MTVESFEIIFQHLLLFLKILLGVLVLRALLYAMGVTYYIPFLDDLSQPLMPFANMVVDGARNTWEALQRFFFRMSS